MFTDTAGARLLRACLTAPDNNNKQRRRKQTIKNCAYSADLVWCAGRVLCVRKRLYRITSSRSWEGTRQRSLFCCFFPYRGVPILRSLSFLPRPPLPERLSRRPHTSSLTTRPPSTAGKEIAIKMRARIAGHRCRRREKGMF